MKKIHMNQAINIDATDQVNLGCSDTE